MYVPRNSITAKFCTNYNHVLQTQIFDWIERCSSIFSVADVLFAKGPKSNSTNNCRSSSAKDSLIRQHLCGEVVTSRKCTGYDIYSMTIKDFPRGEVERSQRDKFYHCCLTQLSHTTLEIEMCVPEEPSQSVLRTDRRVKVRSRRSAV